MPTWSPCDYPHQELTRCIISAFYEVYNDRPLMFADRCRSTQILKRMRASRRLLDPHCGGTVSHSMHWPDPVGCICDNLQTFRADLRLNLLRASRFEVGLLLNFGPQPQLKRLIFSNNRSRR